MIGKHRVIIEADKVNYTFEVKRNITIIQGDSASGKTTLVDLIRTYGRYKEESGISMVSDVPCVAFSGDGDNWKPVLDAYKDSIVFFDEDYSFIFSEDFAAKVKGSSNYYVLITRQPLKNLPYSINEIYGIRRTGKYHFPEKIYHEFYPIYPAQRQREDANTILLVEDEKAGYQFYKRSCNNTECISAKGS